MKKFLSMILALTMVLSLAACGAGGETETTGAPETTAPIETTVPANTEATVETTVPAETEAPVETAPTMELNGAATVLQNIWNEYAEDEKFAIIGGNPEAFYMDGPGSWDMTYAENMTYSLLVPADSIASIEEAGSIIHMMNANTFTCGAFKLTEGTDAKAFADTMQAAVQGNQWMCGFPETLVIANVDGCVVVAFGVNDAMTPFQTHLANAYADAEILYNEAIAA